MFGLPPSVRIYFANELTDMRKGIDGPPGRTVSSTSRTSSRDNGSGATPKAASRAPRVCCSSTAAANYNDVEKVSSRRRAACLAHVRRHSKALTPWSLQEATSE